MRKRRLAMIIGLEIAFILALALSYVGTSGGISTNMPASEPATLKAAMPGLEIEEDPAAYKALQKDLDASAAYAVVVYALKMVVDGKLTLDEANQRLKENPYISTPAIEAATVEGNRTFIVLTKETRTPLLITPTGQLIDVKDFAPEGIAILKMLPDGFSITDTGLAAKPHPAREIPLKDMKVFNALVDLMPQLKAGTPLDEINKELASGKGLVSAVVRAAAEDAEGKQAYMAVAKSGKESILTLFRLTPATEEEKAAGFVTLRESTPVVIATLPPEFLGYIAAYISQFPEEAPALVAAFMNVPEIRQAYPSEELLAAAAAKPFPAGMPAVLTPAQRQALTQEALGILAQLEAFTGLPFKTENLAYLALKETPTFESWQEVVKYLSIAEFEKPVAKIMPAEGKITEVTNISPSVVEGEIVTKEQLVPALRSPGAVARVVGIGFPGVEATAYYQIKGIYPTTEAAEAVQKAKAGLFPGLRHDITIMPAAMLGEEPTRTIGHYRRPIDTPEIIQPLYGEAWIIAQLPREALTIGKIVEKPEVVETVLLIKAEAGMPVVIPPNYGYVVYNPSPEKPLIFASLVSIIAPNEEPYRQLKGPAWHLVSKEGRLAFKINQQYEEVPNIQEVVPLREHPMPGLVEKGQPLSNVFEKPQALQILQRYFAMPSQFEFESMLLHKLYTRAEAPAAAKPHPAGATKIFGIGAGMLFAEAGRTEEIALTVTQELEKKGIKAVSMPEAAKPEEVLRLAAVPVKEIAALREPVEAVSAVGKELEAVEVPTAVGRALLVQPQGEFASIERPTLPLEEIKADNQTKLIITDLDALVIEVGKKPDGTPIYAPTDFAVDIIADLNALSDIKTKDGKQRYYSAVYSNRFTAGQTASVIQQAGIPRSLFNVGALAGEIAPAVQFAVDRVAKTSGISPDVLFRMAEQNKDLIATIAANPNIAGILVQVIMKPTVDKYVSHRQSLIAAIQALELSPQQKDALIGAIKAAPEIRGTEVEPERDKEQYEKMKKLVLEAV